MERVGAQSSVSSSKTYSAQPNLCFHFPQKFISVLFLHGAVRNTDFASHLFFLTLQMGETNFPTSHLSNYYPPFSPISKMLSAPSRTDPYLSSGFCVFHIKSPTNPWLRGCEANFLFGVGESRESNQNDGFWRPDLPHLWWASRSWCQWRSFRCLPWVPFSHLQSLRSVWY